MIRTSVLLLAILISFPDAWGQGAVHVFTPDSSFLGVQIRDVVAEDVQKLNLPWETGVYVEGVQEGSPAEKAGLRVADVILEFAGSPVRSVRQFRRLVAETPAGREVDLVAFRDGERFSRKVALETQSWPQRGFFEHRFESPRFSLDFPRFHADPPNFRFNLRPIPEEARPHRLGILGESVTEQLAEFLAVPEKRGVLVMEVLPDSPAERAGLRAGDVIVTINGEPVEGVSELRRMLKAGTLTLEIVREKQKQEITVELEREEERDRRQMRL